MPWGAAIAAAGSVGSALINKSGSKSTSNDSPAVRAATDLAVQKGSAIADRPYQAYDGNRIADLSGNERSAIDLAKNGGAEPARLLDKSESSLDQSQEAYSGSALSRYMNPYTDAVLNPMIRNQNAQYDRDQATLKNSKAGAFGGDRSAFSSSELEKNHFNNISDATGQVYSDAFKNAQSSFFQDKDRQARGSAAYAQLANGKANLNRQQIQDLMATGGLERLLQQSKNDFDYSQFLEKRDWDVTNLDPLLKSISAAKGASTTTTKSNPGNVADTIIGAGLTLAGQYFGAKDPLKEVDTTAITSKYGTGTALND